MYFSDGMWVPSSVLHQDLFTPSRLGKHLLQWLWTPHSSWSVRARFAPGLALPCRSVGLVSAVSRSCGFARWLSCSCAAVPSNLSLSEKELVLLCCWQGLEGTAGGFPCLVWGDGQGLSGAPLPCAGETLLTKVGNLWRKVYGKRSINYLVLMCKNVLS